MYNEIYNAFKEVYFYKGVNVRRLDNMAIDIVKIAQLMNFPKDSKVDALRVFFSGDLAIVAVKDTSDPMIDNYSNYLFIYEKMYHVIFININRLDDIKYITSRVFSASTTRAEDYIGKNYFTSSLASVVMYYAPLVMAYMVCSHLMNIDFSNDEEKMNQFIEAMNALYRKPNGTISKELIQEFDKRSNNWSILDLLDNSDILIKQKNIDEKLFWFASKRNDVNETNDTGKE